jgi:hypothetical protein
VLGRTAPSAGHPGRLALLDDPVDQLLGLLEALALHGRRDGIVELADVQDVDGPPPAGASSTVAGIALRLCFDWSIASSRFSSIEHLQEFGGRLACPPGDGTIAACATTMQVTGTTCDPHSPGV